MPCARGGRYAALPIRGGQPAQRAALAQLTARVEARRHRETQAAEAAEAEADAAAARGSTDREAGEEEGEPRHAAR